MPGRSRVSCYKASTKSPACAQLDILKHTHKIRGSRFFGVFFGFLLYFFGFMCVDVAKTARVTRMRLMPKLQSVFFG